MKRILIVDDSMFMRSVLLDLLKKNSQELSTGDEIELTESPSKKDALKKIQTTQYDTILLDVVMEDSEMEGLELAEVLKKDKFDMKKIIMLTSIGQHNILDKCRELGIVRYLQKPFYDVQVIKEINEILTA